MKFIWFTFLLIQAASMSAQEGPPVQRVFTSVPQVRDRDWIDKALGIAGPEQPADLTQKARFQQYLLFTAGPLPILGEIAGSGINQWTNTPHEWGQGWEAYGKRLGSNLGYNAVRQTITYGSSAALDEDNRYFLSHKHGLARIEYALVSTVAARKSDGRRTFSFSSVAGVAGASAISSIWGPPSYKGIGHMTQNAGISLSVTAGFNIVREFLPDLRRHSSLLPITPAPEQFGSAR
jgi:hypothetical protein